MNIVQAKKLKVGEFVTWITKSTGYFTQDKSYKITHVDGSLIKSNDDNEVSGPHHIASAGVGYDFLIENFVIAKLQIKTKWIPFDTKRMDEAIGYRSKSGISVTEFNLYSNGEAVCLSGDVLITWVNPSASAEMQVEDKIEYPCLCRRDETDELAVLHCGDSYWTPLTDDELKKIGLIRVKS